MSNSTTLVHSDSYANWVFDPTHPTQGRRFIKAKELFVELMNNSGAELVQIEPRLATRSELSRIHSDSFLDEVLVEHRTSQWNGERIDLAQLATTFVGGTLTALDALLSGSSTTAVHFPGAKHHAQSDHSSGFCVFADFAIAADIATKEFGKKVAILDFDAHHGDGTENLTANNPDILTFSIHEAGIFPGTGLADVPELGIYNAPLNAQTGKGDAALINEVERFVGLARQFGADLIFIAAGADGHTEDPLSSLQFTIEGYKEIALILRRAYSKIPILIGGAGGYLPDSRTPEVWANFAHQIATN